MLEAPSAKNTNRLLKLAIEVENGIVQDVKMSLPSDMNQYASVITNLGGKPYSHELTNSIVKATGCKVLESDVTADTSNIAAL
jgi:hypothetical protein